MSSIGGGFCNAEMRASAEFFVSARRPPVLHRGVKRVLFLQHGDVDKPGLLADSLAEAGVALEVLHAYAGERVPVSLEGFDGLALGGGAQSAWQDAEFPYLAGECRLVRAAAVEGKPVLGLCLGGQLMARACGAVVRRAERRELGFFPVKLAPGADRDPLMRHFPAEFAAAHWHGDVFEIPAGGECLASSAMTPNQAFRMGRGFYGFQFHPEMTAGLFRELVGEDREFFRAEGINADALVREAGAALPRLEKSVRAAFREWAGFL
jgi:GMP synthase (glutamine-hydrolysing)